MSLSFGFLTSKNQEEGFGCLCLTQAVGLVPDIEMDADAYEHGPEREVVLAPYFQVLQAVIVQDAVVHPFAIYFLYRSESREMRVWKRRSPWFFM